MKNVRDRDARQREMIAEALGAGRSVAVDNTNPTPARARAADRSWAAARRARRGATTSRPRSRTPSRATACAKGRRACPTSRIYVTAKKLVPPTLEEGFDEVRVIAPLPVMQ